jgi:hypothetical protein
MSNVQHKITYTVLAAVISGTIAFGAKPVASDIAAPDKRVAAVGMAVRIANLGEMKPLPAELPLPFGTSAFEQTDSEERATAENTSRVAQATVVASDRETLEVIAGKIIPSGTIFLAGEPTLIFGKKPVKIGTHFTVTSNGQDYDIELVRIDRTTFTLRLNREEVTRPIKPGKSP